jgi:hypothetical protein
MIEDPDLRHVSFDISWNELAKYLVASPRSLRISADLLNRHPERFLFGTDEMAPRDQDGYLSVYRQYQPLWTRLDEKARSKILRGNYLRLFDAARPKVRAWERAQLSAKPSGT